MDASERSCSSRVKNRKIEWERTNTSSPTVGADNGNKPKGTKTFAFKTINSMSPQPSSCRTLQTVSKDVTDSEIAQTLDAFASDFEDSPEIPLITIANRFAKPLEVERSVEDATDFAKDCMVAGVAQDLPSARVPKCESITTFHTISNNVATVSRTNTATVANVATTSRSDFTTVAIGDTFVTTSKTGIVANEKDTSSELSKVIGDQNEYKNLFDTEFDSDLELSFATDPFDTGESAVVTPKFQVQNSLRDTRTDSSSKNWTPRPSENSPRLSVTVSHDNLPENPKNSASAKVNHRLQTPRGSSTQGASLTSYSARAAAPNHASTSSSRPSSPAPSSVRPAQNTPGSSSKASCGRDGSMKRKRKFPGPAGALPKLVCIIHTPCNLNANFPWDLDHRCFFVDFNCSRAPLM